MAQATAGRVTHPWVAEAARGIRAGGGERVTLRQVAEYADASNFGAHRNIGGATDDAAIVRKLDVLDTHAAAHGRAAGSILRTHTTMPLFLAETEAALQAKLASIPEQRRQHFAPSTMAGTPREAVEYFCALAKLGMQYCIAFIHPKDIETVRLLAEQVVPEVTAATAPTRSATISSTTTA